MMKRLIVTGGLVLSMAFTLGLASDAMAAGRAAALLVSSGETSAVALIDFNEAQFSSADAQALTSLLQLGVGLLPTLLSQQGINVEVNVVVFTTDQMTGFGLGDAGKANTFIINNFAALGVDTYIRAIATKVNPPAGVTTGQNIRLDLYLLSEAGSTPQYLASLEVQEQLINGLSGLLSFE
jgi:hypothetical protein